MTPHSPASSEDTPTSTMAKKLRNRVNKLKKKLDRLAQSAQSSSSDQSSEKDAHTLPKSKKIRSSTSPSTSHVQTSSGQRAIKFKNMSTQTTNCNYCFKLNHVSYECRLRQRHGRLSGFTNIPHRQQRPNF